MKMWNSDEKKNWFQDLWLAFVISSSRVPKQVPPSGDCESNEPVGGVYETINKSQPKRRRDGGELLWTYSFTVHLVPSSCLWALMWGEPTSLIQKRMQSSLRPPLQKALNNWGHAVFRQIGDTVLYFFRNRNMSTAWIQKDKLWFN